MSLDSSENNCYKIIESLRTFCSSSVYNRTLVFKIPDEIKDMIVRRIRFYVKSGRQTNMMTRLYGYLQTFKIESIPFKKGTITITFGDVAENHVGNQQIGELSAEGFTVDDLKAIQNRFVREYGAITEYVDLNTSIDVLHRSGASIDVLHRSGASIDGRGFPAGVLIIRNAVNIMLGDGDVFSVDDECKVYKELAKLEWDKKFMDRRRKKVLNKHARWNLTMSDEDQIPDYEIGKGRIISWRHVPLLERVFNLTKSIAGEKGNDLNAEGNYYYDPLKCGIGWHGDSERRKTIAVRFGQTMPLAFRWYENGVPIGTKVTLTVNNNDMYFMSEKANGFDWSFGGYKRLHLRHSAGCDKYTGDPRSKVSKKK
jgi:hypothetical protein